MTTLPALLGIVDAVLQTIFICTAHILGLAIGFYAGCRYSRTEIARAELRGLTNRRVLELTPEDAARRVA